MQRPNERKTGRALDAEQIVAVEQHGKNADLSSESSFLGA